MTKKADYCSILDILNGDYDYIFEVLCADILEGDLKAPERPRIPRNASVFRNDIYRAFEHSIGCFDVFTVIKVLKIEGVEFQLGMEIKTTGTWSILMVGCFGHEIELVTGPLMKLMGYGLRQEISNWLQP